MTVYRITSYNVCYTKLLRDRVVFACTKEDAAAIDFDDHFVYQQIEMPIEKRSIPFDQVLRERRIWFLRNGRIMENLRA